MTLKKLTLLLIPIILLSQAAFAMPLKMTKEQLIAYTPDWTGERFDDGRPKVPDDIIERMKKVNIEEAWSVLRNEGYEYQFERGWKHVHPGEVLCGRALTVTYMPLRKSMNDVTNKIGEKEGRIGGQVSWPIDMLVDGDVYVADVYNREHGGPIIGGNLANAIYAKSGNGVLFNGEIRDLEQLEAIEGFNGFVRNWNPGYYWASTIAGINIPTNIGNTVVMPGDVILGKREGVIVIPPHLAQRIVETAEIVQLRDEFGFARLKAGVYTPGQIDTRWAENIEKDFEGWLKAKDDLPMSLERIEELLKERTW